MGPSLGSSLVGSPWTQFLWKIFWNLLDYVKCLVFRAFFSYYTHPTSVSPQKANTKGLPRHSGCNGQVVFLPAQSTSTCARHVQMVTRWIQSRDHRWDGGLFGVPFWDFFI